MKKLLFFFLIIGLVACSKDPFNKPTISGAYRVKKMSFVQVDSTAHWVDSLLASPTVHLFFTPTGKLIEYHDGLEVKSSAYELLAKTDTSQELLISGSISTELHFIDSANAVIFSEIGNILGETKANQLDTFIYVLGP